MLAKMKTETDEATRKREQLFMEHELKRQKVFVEANTTLQQEKLKADRIGKLPTWRPLRKGRLSSSSCRRGNESVPEMPK